jgi:iron(III) transport system substrate-binding protein
MKYSKRVVISTLALACASVFNVNAQTENQEQVLNLYSSRHYQTDEKLYTDFTKLTGIKINRLDTDDNGLLERLKSEGQNSQADVVLMTDASRLWKAETNDLFQPIKSKVLDSKIPQNLRGKDNGEGSKWYGFSTRARVIVYNKNLVKSTDVDTYDKLAEAQNKGKVCTRSGSHPYMMSLLSSIIEEKGEAGATAWAQGMVNNLAKPSKGGDTDQIKSVASGECAVALTNSYYYARLMLSPKQEDKDIVAKTTLLWPNQANNGTHINVAGGGVAKYAPHKENAVKFLEYLASDSAQKYFADGNNEWPVVKGVIVNNTALKSLGNFKQQTVNVYAIGMNQVKAQKILDKVGYK